MPVLLPPSSSAALSASAAARIDLPGPFRQTRSHGPVAAARPAVTTWRDHMTDALEQISGLLHEAGETHHRVYRIAGGADDDWASWYAQWLIDYPSCRTC